MTKSKRKKTKKKIIISIFSQSRFFDERNKVLPIFLRNRKSDQAEIFSTNS